ncbi:g8130 [Coccomyxa viridis]|uniref:G8130 protein n=1 Tax=Coccomyxa viridis TaxID=1274662 RepID=A0ABP1G642_9CHLO
MGKSSSRWGRAVSRFGKQVWNFDKMMLHNATKIAGTAAGALASNPATMALAGTLGTAAGIGGAIEGGIRAIGW